MKKIKILMGGSPCTHWSIAQKNGRETEPSGEGWELFKNYLIAKEKWKPDFFLYENNKSASQPIKDQIAKELGASVGDTRFTYINSALVSAQVRKRFYVTNFGEIIQPEDRGILLKDILESGIVDKEKSYVLKHQAGNVRDYLKKHHTQVAFEPIRIGVIDSESKTDHDSKQYRVYSPEGKSTTLCGQGGGVGAKTGLYATPIRIPEYGEGNKSRPLNAYYSNNCGGFLDRINNSNPSKQQVDIICEPLNLTEDGKSQTIKAQYYKNGTANFFRKGTFGATRIVEAATEFSSKNIYRVQDGQISVNDKRYPINLPDGYYIIRKLTINECKQLQTIPNWYDMTCLSDTQSYKCLGNGWTAEVIKHLLSHIPNLQDYEIEVLSMYDGMACGMIALKELGCNVVKYNAYEIDKYAMRVANHNFPEIIQCGDAFQVRDENWGFDGLKRR